MTDGRTEAAASHEHRWAGRWPSILSTGGAVAREQRQCMDCGLTEDRPPLPGPNALSRTGALGRCQVMLQCHRETGHGGDHEAREAR